MNHSVVKRLNHIINGMPNLIKSISKFSFSSILNFFIGILSVSILTRIFTPDVYGTFNMFNAVVNTLIGLVTLGFPDTIFRFFNDLPNGWSVKELFNKCMIMSLVGWCLFFAITLMFSSSFTLHFFAEDNPKITVLVFTNVLALLLSNKYVANYYRIVNDAKNYTIQQVLVQLFSKIFVAFSYFISVTKDIVLLMNTLGVFLYMLISVVRQRTFLWPQINSWHVTGNLEILKFAFFSWPIVICSLLGSLFVPFLIMNSLGSYAVGIYTSANFFVSVVGVVQNGFLTYWAVFMYEHYKDQQDLICKTHHYIILSTILILFLFIVLQHFAYSMIGSQYHESRAFFTLVLLDPLLLLIQQTTSYGISISKRVYENVLIMLCYLVCMGALSYPLINSNGLQGMAFCCTLSAIVRFILATWRGQRYYKSIVNKYQTALGILLLCLLGFSNTLFSNNFLYEILCAVLIVMVTCAVYKNEVSKIICLWRC